MFFRMYQMILNGSRNGKASSLIRPIANWYPNGRSVLTGESNSMETWAFRSPSSKLAMWTFVLDRFLNIAHINFNLWNCRLRAVGVATSGVYTEGIFFGKAQCSRMLANAKPAVAGQKVDFWLGILCKVYNHDTTYNFLLLSSYIIFLPNQLAIYPALFWWATSRNSQIKQISSRCIFGLSAVSSACWSECAGVGPAQLANERLKALSIWCAGPNILGCRSSIFHLP